MDELDRMFRRLVQNIRNGYPEYLSRPFEVAEVYQSLIPYRHNRRELEIDTNQDYEVALCRLLAGERGYLSGDESMQESIRRELGSPNPNTAIFREFAASRVTLTQDARRRFEQSSGPSEAMASVAAAVGAGGRGEDLPPRPAPSRPPTPPPPAFISSGVTTPPHDFAAMAATTRSGSQGVIGGPCRYCGGALPDDRRAVFCPHCGQNLTIRRCPACNTELDNSWKFCIACGREVTEP
jgi:hypothetical protein